MNDPGGRSRDLSGYFTWTAREQLRQTLTSALDRASKAVAAEARADHAEARWFWKTTLVDGFPTS